VPNESNILPSIIKMNVDDIQKEYGFTKELPDDILLAKLSPLSYLNKLVDTSFLVENKPKKKFGVNINLTYNDSAQEFPTNYPYGLGFKPLKFVSEIYYDDNEKNL